jgi:nucleoside-diphosphate-sugar epimerase
MSLTPAYYRLSGANTDWAAGGEQTRDFCFVGDVAKANLEGLEREGKSKIYNIGSGQPRTVQSLLETMLSLSAAQIRVEFDPERMRPSDTPVVYCDAKKVTGRHRLDTQHLFRADPP